MASPMCAAEWAWVIWRSRLAGILLAAALWANAAWTEPRGSVAGGLARLEFLQSSRRGCTLQFHFLVWREHDGNVHAGWGFDPAVQARVEALAVSLQGGVSIATHRGPSPLRAVALWAPMTSTTTEAIFGLDHNASLSPTEVAEYRAAAYDFLCADPATRWPPTDPALRTADLRTTRLLPIGILQNMLAIATLSALVAWFRPIARTRGTLVASLAERRRAHGQCAACGYSTEGLVSGRCPECGGLHN